MAARKRPSLKGRGAAIFLEEPSRPTQIQALPERPHAGTPESPKASMPESPQTRTPEGGNTRTPAFAYTGPKEKATFYLPEELLFTLEVVWRDLRVMTRSKVSKSDIVQAALHSVLTEFQEQGADGHLVKALGLSVREASSDPGSAPT